MKKIACYKDYLYEANVHSPLYKNVHHVFLILF